ncbi:MAG: O-antigen ligase family protein, partial [Bdellovibrionales bacterium]
LGLIALAAYRPVFGFWPHAPKNFARLMAGIFALMLLSSIWSVDPSMTLERSSKAIAVILGGVLLIAVAVNLPRQTADIVEKYAPYVFLASLAYCLYELYSPVRIYDLIRPDEPPSFADNLSHMNRSVVILTLFFLIIFQNLRQNLQTRRNKILLGMGTLGMLAVILQTDSQGAQVGFVIGLLFCFAYPYKSGKAFAVIAGLIAAVMIAAPLIPGVLLHNLPPYIAGNTWLTSSASALPRMEIWDFIARRALQSPIIGHGMNAARVIDDFDTAMLYHPSRHVLHPHNFVLQIWLEFGLVGAALATAFLIYLLRAILQSPAAALYLPVFCAALTIAGTTYGLWQSWWLGCFFLIAALAVILAKSYPQNPKASSLKP